MSATLTRTNVGHSRGETQSHSADVLVLPADHGSPELQSKTVGGHLLIPGPAAPATHRRIAGDHLLPADQCYDETHSTPVGGPPPAPPTTIVGPAAKPPASGWGELRICADLFARAQGERIAVQNMLLHTDNDMFGPHLAHLEATEHDAKLMLRRCYKRVAPAELRQFQKEHSGIGEDSFARILGHLGDPYIATPHWWEGTGTNRRLMVGDPYVRTISQLWSYCGHGDPTRKPTKGMTAEEAFAMGSPTLKMLVHLQAEWCMKRPAGNKFRDVYEAERAKAESKVHSTPCKRCGPSGKPAEEGTPWSKAHQHAHALRVVGKEILRGMWLARHHAETNGVTA